MNVIRLIIFFFFFVSSTSFFVPETTLAGQKIPLPSRWKGEAVGQVFGRAFRLPVVIEIKKPLPGERNPFHLFIGDEGPKNTVGGFFMSSALQFFASGGKVTLQYLTIEVTGSQIRATLTDEHRAEAAAANGFTAPNVSAQYSSDLMRGVLQEALGPTEMFAFQRGATIIINVAEDQLTGTVRGSGSSYVGSSHQNVGYQTRFSTKRVR